MVVKRVVAQRVIVIVRVACMSSGTFHQAPLRQHRHVHRRTSQ